jgi:hypothetical protein
MTIYEINDKPIRDYLSGRISLDDLRRHWTSESPWEITKDGQVIAIPTEAYEARFRDKILKLYKESGGMSQSTSIPIVPCWWMKDLGKPASGCRCHGNLAICLNPDRKDRDCITVNCRPDKCENYRATQP